MKFILEIELGNDSMQNWDDIECALIDVKHDVRELAEIPSLPSPGNYEGIIRDDNGNTVGRWEVIASRRKREHNTGCTADGPADACDYCRNSEV